MKFPAICPSKTHHFPANFTAKPKLHVQKLLGKISGHSKPNHIGNSVQVLTENSCSFSISTRFKDEREQELENSSNDKSWIHLVGIGGCGLSALAMLALKHVYGFCQVTWSFNTVMRLVARIWDRVASWMHCRKSGHVLYRSFNEKYTKEQCLKITRRRCCFKCYSSRQCGEFVCRVGWSSRVQARQLVKTADIGLH